MDSKRLSFPRFYFLSNDELLEILGQSKEPNAVQVRGLPFYSKLYVGGGGGATFSDSLQKRIFIVQCSVYCSLSNNPVNMASLVPYPVQMIPIIQ